MQKRDKFRLKKIIERCAASRFGFMKGKINILGDIVSPAFDESWDSELGIAYHGKNGPVYYTGNGFGTTDDLKK